MIELALICDRMDYNFSGGLSLQEMVGYGGSKSVDNGQLLADVRVYSGQ